jgi:hypothetical protein
MAHFAQLSGNVVTQVIVVSNEVIKDENGVEVEQMGIDFCKSLFGGEWIQTSYNSNFRGRYAGVGYTYDKELDEFIEPDMELPNP